MSLPRRTSRHRPHASRGFSLVELMIALTISLVLFAGALSIYFTSRTTYSDNDRLARLQETGRIALDLIVRDVRSAGWVGCMRDAEFANDLTAASAGEMRWDFRRPLQGYDGNGSTIDAAAGATGRPAFAPALLTVATVTPDPASDVLVIRGPARDGAPLELAAATANFTDPVTIDPPPAGMAPGSQPGVDDQVMMVTDCLRTSVFRMTGFGSNEIQHVGGVGVPANASDALGFTFQADGIVMPLRTVVYWIAQTPGAADVTSRSLFRRVNDLPAEELLPGVESLQLLFGEDTPRDGTVDAYRNARAVTDWNNVAAVQVALLVRTPDEEGTLQDTQTYPLLDATVTAPDDRRQRMVFQTTASLRNLL